MAELTEAPARRGAEPPARERGVRLIIAYKTVRGVLWLVLALALIIATEADLGARLLDAAVHLRRHTGAWSLELAELLTRAAEGRTLWVLIVALVADAALTLVEAWALRRGHAWGSWLVVASTGSLLPFEVVAFVRHLHVERGLLLFINAAIVAYLARVALRERRAERAARAKAAG